MRLIIILGFTFNKDGTIKPILKSRLDKACVKDLLNLSESKDRVEIVG